MLIEQLLTNELNAGKLVMKNAALSSSNIAALLELLPADILDIKEYTLHTEGDTITIDGTGSFFGLDNAAYTLALTAENGSIKPQIEVKLPASTSISLPKFDALAVQPLGFALSLGENPSGSLRATLRLDSLELPMKVSFPAATEGWLLEYFGEGIQLPGLDTLARLTGWSDLSSTLPAGLGSGLELKTLEVSFDPHTRTVHQIVAGLQTATAWDLIEGKFALQHLSLRLTASDVTDASLRSYAFVVEATTRIADVEIPIYAEGPDEHGQWQLTSTPAAQLPSLADLLEVFDSAIAADLPDGLRTIGSLVLDQLTLRFNPGQRSVNSLMIGLTTNDPWTILKDQFVVSGVGMEVMVEDLQDSANRTITGNVGGNVAIAGSQMTLYGEFDEQFTVTGTLDHINLTTLVDALIPDFEFPSEVPALTLTDVNLEITPRAREWSLSARSADQWAIPIGVDNLTLQGISLAIKQAEVADPKPDQPARRTSGRLSGSLTIATATVDASYDFPGEFVIGGKLPTLSLSPLVQALCSVEVLQGIPVPVGALALELTDLALNIAPLARFASFSGGSPYGRVELLVKRTSAGGWGFNAAFVPPDQWKLSTIDSSLAVLDDINFSGSMIVFASSDDRALTLTTVKLPREDVRVERGMNFFAAMDMRGTGVDKVIGLETLEVYAAIGKPSDIVIEAIIGGSFQIAEDVMFGNVRLRLSPSPGNFSISLLGSLTANIQGNQLEFVGGMTVTPTSASFQTTMIGVWKDPFDARGVTIANVAIDLGITFTIPPLPVIGIAGEVVIGSLNGSAAVRIDAGQLSRSMIALAFNRLYVLDVISAFTSPSLLSDIPTEVRETVLNVGLEDVDIYIVPQPTRIGEIQFEQGFRLRGRLNAWGITARAEALFDYTQGTLISGEVDGFDLGGLIKLSGAQGRPNAVLYLDLRAGKRPVVDISGALTILGLTAETSISINEHGFNFLMSGRIFDLFEASLQVSGSSLGDSSGMYIRATMRNDLFAYLRNEASKALQKAANDATASISAHQADVTRAEANVKRLDTDIDGQRAIVRAERDRDAGRLRNAQSAVQNAQNEVNRLNTVIAQQRAIVQAERDRDAGRLRNAQVAVQNAQYEVNRLQGEIDRMHRRIAVLNAEIAAKKKWVDDSPWYRKFDRGLEFTAFATAKGTEITGLYTAIGGVETAKFIATQVLEVAKQTLRGMELAAIRIPVDADPRVSGPISARATALLALEAARVTLRGMEQAAITIPIDSDPRVWGLIGARATALGVLAGYQQTLEASKVAVRGALQVTDYIVKFGLGGLIDIRAASFEGWLGNVGSGYVSLSVTLQFMGGTPQPLSLSFNFGNPLEAAEALARQLLPA